MQYRKILLTGLLLCLIGGTSACSDDGKYEKYADAERYAVGNVEFTVTQVQEVEIDWLGGSVEVEQSTDKIRIVEEEGEQNQAERMHYYLDEGVLKIKYCQSGLRSRVATEKKHLLVALPKGVSLHIESKDAAVSIGNLETRELSVDGVLGNFTAERIVCTEADIDTVSGQVRIGELDAKEVSLDTDSGNVTISKLSTDFFEAESKSGSLFFGLQKATRTKDAIESTDGEVTIALAEGLPANIRFQSPSGTVKTSLPYRKEGMNYLFGEGQGCFLNVKTFNGNLIVQ